MSIPRYPEPHSITPTAGIPDENDPNQVIEVSDGDNYVTIRCYGDDNGATDITHIVWGFLAKGTNQYIELERYENLETVGTPGKYVFTEDLVGMKVDCIGVQETANGGPPLYTLQAYRK